MSDRVQCREDLKEVPVASLEAPPAGPADASVEPGLESNTALVPAIGIPKTPAKRWKSVLKLSVGVGIVAYLLYKIPFATIWAAIVAAKWQLLAWSTLATLLVHWTTADRLRRLLATSGSRISTFGIFEINLSTLFYGLFLPGGNVTGIAIRFYRLSAEKQNALATGVALFSDRVVSTITLLLVGIAFWLPDRPEEGVLPLAVMTAAMVGLVGTIFLFLAADRIPPIRPLHRLAMRLGGSAAEKIRQALHDQTKLPRSALLMIFCLSIVTHLLGIYAYTLIARSLGIDVGFVEMGWIRSAIILATMVPLTPSGIGLREGASLLLLGSLGVGQETAMAFSLLVFGMTILLVGLVGGLFEARRLAHF